MERNCTKPEGMEENLVRTQNLGGSEVGGEVNRLRVLKPENQEQNLVKLNWH
jgi:hypothetical protein